MKTFQNIDKKNTFSFALKSDRKEHLGDSQTFITQVCNHVILIQYLSFKGDNMVLLKHKNNFYTITLP